MTVRVETVVREAAAAMSEAFVVNDQLALTAFPSASRAPLLSETSNAWPAARGWSGVTDSWVDFSFHVILPATSAPVTVSVMRSALFVAERSILWLNHIEMLAGSTSFALRRGSVFVSCALDCTMNEKLPSPPRALPSRSCAPITLIV